MADPHPSSPSTDTATATATAAAAAAHLAWQQERLQQVSGPVGNTALIDYQPVGAEPAAVRGLPATVRRVPGENGVRVTPTGPVRLHTAAGVTPLTGETLVNRLGVEGLPLLSSGGITVDVFGLDATAVELRIYDAAAPTRLAFAGIEVAEYDPRWAVDAVFRSSGEIQRVPWGFTRASDDGHTKAVPGTVEATIEGVPSVFTVFADGNHLVLVFADATTGRSSYAPGRFLRFPAVPDGAALTLDFNRAIVPPCGFSDFYSCPIPPAENRIAAAVVAGELRARRSGEQSSH
ncbi:DUF1684 domain-containing protein [Nakamurella flavida]|uniref:DUF1684 domain-containing protein n=1 Tax=Nakamurella flavida TaxID=363630 RepID=A0A938YNY2_9ACTN|nr:DUF1684 domain-containing protein [Nakamurella flavida]MBM9476528.1 DUF1684 domain-containing protein [Nakamurella flavida]MDP9779034.1 uncharacterized protein (DUF1684 family) [Nakamurella flavida]